MREAIRLHCGVGETTWNYHPVSPGAYACISPVYGQTEEKQSVNSVQVPSFTAIIQDSGAFSDGPTLRLSVEEALERQIAHAERYGYASQVTHRASYDLLIDEKWEGGRRYKSRWTEEDAQFACKLTVKAADYLSRNRYGLSCILSAQGVSAKQYLACTKLIVPYMADGDLFGLGGWCVAGKFPRQIMPVFQEAMQLVIPFLGREGVKQVHIWGVCYGPALNDLLWLCQEHGITLSTDSMGPSLRPVRGRWGYRGWTDKTYTQPPVLDSCKSGEHHLCVGCRGLERARHVEVTRKWLAGFQAERPAWLNKPKQLFLLEEAS